MRRSRKWPAAALLLTFTVIETFPTCPADLLKARTVILWGPFPTLVESHEKVNGGDTAKNFESMSTSTQVTEASTGVDIVTVPDTVAPSAGALIATAAAKALVAAQR